MEKNLNLYAVLKIPDLSSMPVIEQAFRKIEKTKTANVVQLLRAYQILLDPVKRAKYNREFFGLNGRLACARGHKSEEMLTSQYSDRQLCNKVCQRPLRCNERFCLRTRTVGGRLSGGDCCASEQSIPKRPKIKKYSLKMYLPKSFEFQEKSCLYKRTNAKPPTVIHTTASLNKTYRNMPQKCSSMFHGGSQTYRKSHQVPKGFNQGSGLARKSMPHMYVVLKKKEPAQPAVQTGEHTQRLSKKRKAFKKSKPKRSQPFNSYSFWESAPKNPTNSEDSFTKRHIKKYLNFFHNSAAIQAT